MKVTSRYPRAGERVAPYTVREFLMEPIPAPLAEKLGGADLKLCDLDETVWERFPAEILNELAQIIVERISAHQVRKAFQDRHFPRPPAGTHLADLHLENRTRRCLVAKDSTRTLRPWATIRSARSCRCGRSGRDAWSIC